MQERLEREERERQKELKRKEKERKERLKKERLPLQHELEMKKLRGKYELRLDPSSENSREKSDVAKYIE